MAVRLILLFSILAISATLVAQIQQPPLPLRASSPSVKADIEKARKIAGTEWGAEAHYFCEAPYADAPSDPVIEPVKIFDNVYAIGNAGLVAYVISTSDGLIMIDSSRPNFLETQLLPGFQKLGLDPSKVKMILITHGHADHFGGAAYFQEHYGSHVYVAQGDWDLMEHPPARKGAGPTVTIPKHDMVIAEAALLTFEDLRAAVVYVANSSFCDDRERFVVCRERHGRFFGFLPADFARAFHSPGVHPLQGHRIESRT